MLVDLNSGSGFVYGRAADDIPIGARINAHINAALETENARRTPREYLGASRIGEECSRRLVYEYTHKPVDPGKEFSGQTLRIFAVGHAFEDLVIAWFRRASFDLRTHKRNGEQFGFITAKGRFRGHIDGVIVDGPEVGIDWPALWEHKALKASSWRDTAKKGVRSSKPVYYAQMQIYMAYMDLQRALFTALNKDTCELYHEIVTFEPEAAQRLSDKAADILLAAEHDELPPRIAHNADFYLCRFCPYAERCWKIDA